MKQHQDLKDISNHFAFGENWSSYSTGVSEENIREAQAGLSRLLADHELQGKTFLDIGCGSGVHSVAALRKGAARVLATDIDPASVATARKVLARFAGPANWEAVKVSVFDLSSKKQGTFDIVYSWGVLHHTGAMVEAIERAASMVAPDGLFVVALYKRTPMCKMWTLEKRLYSRMPGAVQRMIQSLYVGLIRLGFWARGRSFAAHLKTYKSIRGMDFYYDAHDWLGGYPYESISCEQTDAVMGKIGFKRVRHFPIVVSKFGILGSGCEEYVYARDASAA